MKRLGVVLLLIGLLAVGALPAAASPAAAAECEPAVSCFGLESVSAGLSTAQAGGHPDLTLGFSVKQNPESSPNVFGLHQTYAPVRDIRIETPPGLVGEPNIFGVPQQCTVQELDNFGVPGGGCPNGSQVGVSRIALYGLTQEFLEPVYMMTAPGGDAVARLGLVAGFYPTFIDLRVRSEHQDDFGLTAEIQGTSPNGEFVEVETTLWGVPASPSHDTERCTSREAFNGCTESTPRPPGSRLLSFMTNPTNCSGVGGQVSVSVDSWLEPGRFVSKGTTLPPISGCDKLPFKPSLAVEPTSHRAAGPTGLQLTYRLPAPEGVGVLESSELKDLRIDFPPGMAINSASADGLETCSPDQVGFGRNEDAHCPDAAKLGVAEFDVPALPRRMKGSLYLREPEPGHLFRIWVVADDLGAHIKLPGELEVDEGTGQIHSVVLGLPQVPVREVKLLLKSGLRAPLVNPPACGTYQTHWEFTPWSGGAPVGGNTPMTIDERCGTGGFAPGLEAGTTDPTAGTFAPFLFRVTSEDGEQNPARIDVSLPLGMTASFAGIPHCEGADAETGSCPAGSKLGGVTVATGAGPNPLWVPQAGKRPTAVYLGGPYEGAPVSVVAVVPAQAGPFDLGDQVVRTPIYVDPRTAQATAKSDPLPQMLQGVPVEYRTIELALDRPGFTLNPTSCKQKRTVANLSSAAGAAATATYPYAASNCAALPFKPALKLKLRGGTHRSDHPHLRAVLRMPKGGANIDSASVALPHSEFLDQGSLNRVCTRGQFAAKACPAGSVYGTATARTPLFDFPLRGNVYLGTGYGHKLPDLVAELKGPPSFPIEVDLDGRVDELNGGLRTTFEGVPDAPVSEFVLDMRGGKRGLIENSTNLCNSVRHATATFTGQNGRVRKFRPVLGTSCGAGKHHSRHRHGKH
jgi:hypothetical protein